MPVFSLHDLREIMRTCAGVDEAVDLDGDIAGVPFTELGYDSLAVMEIFARIQQKYGVVVPDEMQDTLGTPDAVIGYVSSAIAS